MSVDLSNMVNNHIYVGCTLLIFDCDNEKCHLPQLTLSWKQMMKSLDTVAIISAVVIVARCSILFSKRISLEERMTIPVTTIEDVSSRNFNWVVSVEKIGVEESCLGVNENITELGVFFPNYYKTFRLPQVHSWVAERDEGDIDDTFNDTSNPVRTRLLGKDTITLVAKTNQLEIVLWSFSKEVQSVLLQVGC